MTFYLLILPFSRFQSTNVFPLLLITGFVIFFNVFIFFLYVPAIISPIRVVWCLQTSVFRDFSISISTYADTRQWTPAFEINPIYFFFFIWRIKVFRIVTIKRRITRLTYDDVRRHDYFGNRYVVSWLLRNSPVFGLLYPSKTHFSVDNTEHAALDENVRALTSICVDRYDTRSILFGTGTHTSRAVINGKQCCHIPGGSPLTGSRSTGSRTQWRI